MSWLNELFDSVRGHVNTTGEALADSQAIPALEQKIRDAKKDLGKSKSALTEIMSQEKMTKKRVNDLEASLTEHEEYAVQANEKGDDSLLNEIVDKIAEIEDDLGAQREVHTQLEANVGRIKATVLETERGVKAMDREVKNIKATEYAQRAAEATAAQHSGSSASMASAAERMKRIKARQEERRHRMDAARELADVESGDDLKAKLADAGIGAKKPSRDAILERINARKSAG
jgi:phage shock protein A